jgi:hypothetical protein
MSWEDRLATWVDHQVVQHPALDRWLELHLHAVGIHGPAARHLLKTRVLPAVIAIGAATLLLLAVLLVGRARRSRSRRRLGAALARPVEGP